MVGSTSSLQLLLLPPSRRKRAIRYSPTFRFIIQFNVGSIVTIWYRYNNDIYFVILSIMLLRISFETLSAMTSSSLK